MEQLLSEQRALVTGAGKGIGREIAIHLAAHGAHVVAAARSRADLESLRLSIGAEILIADLRDVGATRRMAEDAGPIDILVNNAGISIPQPFLSTTIEAFDETLAVNLRAAFLVAQVVASGMVDRGRGGSIINISSQASMVALEDHVAYCASKGALDQLTRAMALELGPHGIRVNSVNPTVTMTPMAEAAWADPHKRAKLQARIPLGRFAVPSDVASVVAFLASRQAAMITGVMLPVDGGFLAC